MAMVYKYINSLTQLGDTQNTLLLSDDSGLFPDQRIEKLFKGVPDVDELHVIAMADYDLYVSMYQAVTGG